MITLVYIFVALLFIEIVVASILLYKSIKEEKELRKKLSLLK